jgi:hypothetical protein
VESNNPTPAELMLAINSLERKVEYCLPVLAGSDREGYGLKSIALWQELKSLFDIIDSGNRRYQVPPYCISAVVGP